MDISDSETWKKYTAAAVFIERFWDYIGIPVPTILYSILSLFAVQQRN